jgi:hypothetical protein
MNPRRAKGDPAEAAIARFWSWWGEARGRDLTDPSLIARMHERVSAIDPGLEWEFGPGREARHVLVVSSGGDPALRALAERWRRAGPPNDAIFEYASARRPDPAALRNPLEIAGRRIDLSALRFAARPHPSAGVVDVDVWHPDFATMTDVQRSGVKFLALDWLLGEDMVEIWLGRIKPVIEPGPALTADELAALMAERVPADGKLRWRRLTGTRAGHASMAAAQVPLRAATHPAHDLHVRVEVPYADRAENGLPTRAALDELYVLEDRLYQQADGAVLVAHEMSDGVWTDHFYADRQVAAEALRPLVATWPHGPIRLTTTADPRWSAVAHLSR